MMVIKQKKGFTLIELLISIVVIGVLAGILLSVINAARIRGTARDAQRASDLGRVQAALELYYAQKRSYPPSTAAFGWVNLGTGGSSTLATDLAGYINKFPVDPVDNDSGNHTGPCNCSSVDADGNCTDSFRYNYKSDGSTYLLTAIMEVPESAEPSLCTDHSAWGTSTLCASGGSASNNCYVVQNP